MIQLVVFFIYYSKFDQGQTFILVLYDVLLIRYTQFYYKYEAQLSLNINVITFDSVFYKLFSQSCKKHRPPKICNCVATLSNFVILSFIPSHKCIALRKCFHNQYAVYLKTKTDFLKNPEFCDFWLKTCGFFLPENVFSLKIFPLCTRSVELKTESRYMYAHWFRFYNFLK